MQVFMTKWFRRWATGESLTDDALLAAVDEIRQGLIDADLGGHVIKKRMGTRGRGRRGSVRTLLAFQLDKKVFFIYGFSKNERSNISHREFKSLRLLASELLGYTEIALDKAIRSGELIEVRGNG
jgi:hypothetical protein